MKKGFWIAVLASITILLSYAYGAEIISRLTRGILVVGGTSSTNGKTVVVSTSSTNEYTVEVVTATVAADEAFTNTFGTAYIDTPTVIMGHKSGASVTDMGNPVATVSTTKLIVSGLNAAGSTNNIPFIIYGYKRTGKFE